MIGFSADNLLLDSHGLLMFLTLIYSAFVFGAIYFRKAADPQWLFRLKVSSIVAFAMIVGLMITGIIPDTAFGSGATFTSHFTNDFGTFSSQVTDHSLSHFTGPLLFDMMEHVTLIVPGLAAVIGFLIWHFEDRVVTDSRVRNSVLSLMILSGIWIVVLGMIGVYLTKTLTFPIQ